MVLVVVFFVLRQLLINRHLYSMNIVDIGPLQQKRLLQAYFICIHFWVKLFKWKQHHRCLPECSPECSSSTNFKASKIHGSVTSMHADQSTEGVVHLSFPQHHHSFCDVSRRDSYDNVEESFTDGW